MRVSRAEANRHVMKAVLNRQFKSPLCDPECRDNKGRFYFKKNHGQKPKSRIRRG